MSGSNFHVWVCVQLFVGVCSKYLCARRCCGFCHMFLQAYSEKDLLELYGEASFISFSSQGALGKPAPVQYLTNHTEDLNRTRQALVLVREIDPRSPM